MTSHSEIPVSNIPCSLPACCHHTSATFDLFFTALPHPFLRHCAWFWKNKLNLGGFYLFIYLFIFRKSSPFMKTQVKTRFWRKSIKVWNLENHAVRGNCILYSARYKLSDKFTFVQESKS